MEVGDTVIFKSRKWLYVDNLNGKALLQLMPGERPYIQNYQSVNMITTKNINKLGISNKNDTSCQ